MAHKHLLLPFALSLLALTSAISVADSKAAATESTLHSFVAQRNGSNPQGGLIADAAGNLYGVTSSGGAYGFGTVFELIPDQGGWTQKILYSFTGGSDGREPLGRLTFDSAGNLYGVTIGNVFELEPNRDGSWTISVLQTFADEEDLEAGLVFDQAGNLYGTTISGGSGQGGIVFELSPSSSGGWTQTVLYSFSFSGGPSNPVGELVLDKAGNIFGALAYGGNGCSGGCGAIYELSPASGQWNLTILHNFTAGTDGAFPSAGLISDAAGNLYGVTQDGGGGGAGFCNYGCGTVFKLAPAGNGQWTETVLYSFQGRTDGSFPGGELVFDSAGNLYGTVSSGGGGPCSFLGVYGCGTAFQLTPSASGQWTESVLWRFSKAPGGTNPSSGLLLNAPGQLIGETYYGNNPGHNGTVFALTPSKGSWSLSVLSSFVDTDGDYPTAGVVADAAGNLYGTTSSGGANGLGGVFELTPAVGGGWKENVIYSFQTGRLQHMNAVGSETFPSALILDAQGNLYGETETGSALHAGTVYELSRAPGGGWTEIPVYTFTGAADGSYPSGGLVMDKAGNLFGTTVYGGDGITQGNLLSGNGVVFELSPVGNGKWSQKVIYTFAGYPSDGAHPEARLIFDQAGNLYGTTFQGGDGTCLDDFFGSVAGCGTVFELSPTSGTWTESVLYTFTSFANDGALPAGGLVFDQAGNLFGTTKHGAGGSGCYYCGTVFELSPASGGGWTESLAFVFPGSEGGTEPLGDLIADQAGNLYGTTSFNSMSCIGAQPCGTVFKLSPITGGGWSATTLHFFTNGLDGGSPYSGVVFGPGGLLYGTTVDGGAADEGVVFAIKP